MHNNLAGSMSHDVLKNKLPTSKIEKEYDDKIFGDIRSNLPKLGNLDLFEKVYNHEDYEVVQVKVALDDQYLIALIKDEKDASQHLIQRRSLETGELVDEAVLDKQFEPILTVSLDATHIILIKRDTNSQISLDKNSLHIFIYHIEEFMGNGVPTLTVNIYRYAEKVQNIQVFDQGYMTFDKKYSEGMYQDGFQPEVDIKVGFNRNLRNQTIDIDNLLIKGIKEYIKNQNTRGYVYTEEDSNELAPLSSLQMMMGRMLYEQYPIQKIGKDKIVLTCKAIRSFIYVLNLTDLSKSKDLKTEQYDGNCGGFFIRKQEQLLVIDKFDEDTNEVKPYKQIKFDVIKCQHFLIYNCTDDYILFESHKPMIDQMKSVIQICLITGEVSYKMTTFEYHDTYVVPNNTCNHIYAIKDSKVSRVIIPNKQKHAKMTLVDPSQLPLESRLRKQPFTQKEKAEFNSHYAQDTIKRHIYDLYEDHPEDAIIKLKRKSNGSEYLLIRKLDNEEYWLCIHKHCRFEKLVQINTLLKNVLYFQDENGLIELIYSEFLDQQMTSSLKLLTIDTQNQCSIKELPDLDKVTKNGKIKVVRIYDSQQEQNKMSLLQSSISEKINASQLRMFVCYEDNNNAGKILISNVILSDMSVLLTQTFSSDFYDLQTYSNQVLFGIDANLYVQDFRVLNDQNQDTLKLSIGESKTPFHIHEHLIVSVLDQCINISSIKGLNNQEVLKIQIDDMKIENGNFIIKSPDNNDSRYFYVYTPSQIVKVNLVANEIGSYNGLLDLATLTPYATEISLDVNKSRITYEGSMEKSQIGFLQTQYGQPIEFYKVMKIGEMSQLEVIDSFKNGIPQEYLTYYPDFGSFLHLIALKTPILEEFFKALSVMNKDDIPLLFYRNQEGLNPLDIAILTNQTKAVQLLLNILIEFQGSTISNFIVDKHLCHLIENNFDLKNYFESNLACYQLIDDKFPSLHEDEDCVTLGVDLQFPRQILNENYDKEELGDTLMVEPDQNQKDGEPLNSIEYFLINIPETMTADPKRFMKTLADCERMEIFENITIQTVINYKWQTYTKSFFQMQFVFYVLFILGYVVDLFYSLHEKDYNADLEVTRDDRNLAIMLVMKGFCCVILAYFGYYEIKSSSLQERYFEDPWNYIDFGLIAIYVPTMILDIFNFLPLLCIILQCLVVFLSFLKVNFFLRIYDGFSFLVSMMAGVFKDIKYFLYFFSIILVEFGILFIIIFQAGDLPQYKGLGHFGYLMMSFRLSTGDFELDDYASQKPQLILATWAIWVSAVFVLNLIFMNFIIAVISESYERVMTKLVAQSYKVKVDMIVERELHMDYSQINQKNFPKNLFLRRTADLDESGEEWQGFIKDLKATVKTSSNKTQNDLNMRMNQMKLALTSDVKFTKTKILSRSKEIKQNLAEIKKVLQHRVAEKQAALMQ
eukprot:403377082